MFWEGGDAISNIEELAAMHRREGNVAQAKSLYACLIAMIKKKSGPDCDEMALTFYQLGEIYDDEGKESAARTYYKRAADVWQTHHSASDNHPAWYKTALNKIGDTSLPRIENVSALGDDRRSA